MKGGRCFSFEEVKKYTNNFSPENEIGSGGYGKVTLLTSTASVSVPLHLAYSLNIVKYKTIKEAKWGGTEGVLILFTSEIA